MSTERQSRKAPRIPLLWPSRLLTRTAAHQPTLSRADAVKAGLVDRATYDKIAPLHAAVVRHHLAAGTPRDQWEPTEAVVRALAWTYVASATQELADLLRGEVDPWLEDRDRLLWDADLRLKRLSRLPEVITVKESGATYTRAAAVQREHDLCRRIEADRAAGLRIHERAPAWLTKAARRAPWVQSSGLVIYLMVYAGLPLAFWRDVPGWTLAALLVGWVLLGQTWAVDRAAGAHNHGREADADWRPTVADAAVRERTANISVVLVTSLGVVAALVDRGIVAGVAGPAPVLVMVLVAVTLELVLPTVRFLGPALDGSRSSRERDALAGQLTADRIDYDDLYGQIERNLRSAEDIGRFVETKAMPDVLDRVKRMLMRAEAPYAFLRTQIGGLAELPPAAPGNAATSDLPCPIPGAAGVTLQPMLDRVDRLRLMREHAEQLETSLRAVPVHPWTG